jgi:crotonobetainyl-CoA:carnitine CoA-transferase CaiB-like acyl-CoA transferase
MQRRPGEEGNIVQPLTGTLVLDLARGYPGAYTAMFLGDFGADIIRVDPSLNARIPMPHIDSNSAKFAAFNAMNRNKKSIVLNLKIKEGLDVFYNLVKKADILIEGFRPGVAARLKIDYPTLQKINSRLIYCSQTGFGQDGPYAALPGHDMNFIAWAGALSLIGQKDGPPCIPGNFLADMGGGLHGAIGVLLAVIAREKTGKGQFVDIAYLDAVISLLVMEASIYFATGQVPKRGNIPSPGTVPYANVYKCKDGEYLTLGCVEPQLWVNLCQALGRDDLASSQHPPEAKIDSVIAALADIFLARTRDEWLEFFKGKEVAISPVLNLNETFADPQVRHRRMLLEFDHPGLGRVRQIGVPIKLSETPGAVRSLGVVNNANAGEILLSLGYSQEVIDRMRKRGILG